MGKLRPRLVIGLSHKSHKKPTMSGLFFALICKRMNYDAYLTNSFIPYMEVDQAIVQFTDGSLLTMNFSDYDIDLSSSLYSVVGTLTNRAKFASNKQISALAVNDGSANGLDLFISTYNDFVMFESDEDIASNIEYTYNITGKSIDNEYYEIGLQPNLNRYDITNYRQYHRNRVLGSFSASLTDDDYERSVFDFNQVVTAEDASAELVLRGENVSYYKAFLHITNNNDFERRELHIRTGNYLGAMAQNEFDRGYSHGRADGYISGYDTGYDAGLSAGNATTTQSDAFDYIGSAFGAVGNILSIEVLPHITIGLCFSIPLVIVLIMSLFKLIRK